MTGPALFSSLSISSRIGRRVFPVVAVLLLVAAPAAEAATIQVTTTVDENENSCTNGDCSLRDAIFVATAGDTIAIPAATYTLTLGELQIGKNLTLSGAGAGTTIIQANAAPAMATNRVLLISAGTVLLDGLTLRHGAGVDVGGGILNSGTLTLQNCTITAHKANNSGGGIFSSGDLTLTNTTVSGNTAGGNNAQNTGGGIAMGAAILAITDSMILDNAATRGTDEMNPGEGIAGGLNLNGSTTTITTSTISSNTAEDDAGGIRVLGGTLSLDRVTVADNLAGADGGGLFNFAGGTVTVLASTFSGNMAGTDGGGIKNDDGTVNVTNSTLSGNSADGGGGGAYNIGTMNFSNATVTDNTADADMDDTGQGGGVHGSSFGGDTTQFKNTIVAGNANPCPTCTAAPDCRTPVDAFTSLGYNVIGDSSQCSGFVAPLGGPGDQVGGGLDPVLAAGLGNLVNNGGPTRTHALLAGSVAIDAGNPMGCTDEADMTLTADQRGLSRPDGTACDVGSYEHQLLIFADGFETGNTSRWSLTVN